MGKLSAALRIDAGLEVAESALAEPRGRVGHESRHESSPSRRKESRTKGDQKGAVILQLLDENARLRRIVAALALDKQTLIDAIREDGPEGSTKEAL
ncbi:MAG: hypothetical protein R2712_30035 [Vicinamibacterales bacterium]